MFINYKLLQLFLPLGYYVLPVTPNWGAYHHTIYKHLEYNILEKLCPKVATTNRIILDN